LVCSRHPGSVVSGLPAIITLGYLKARQGDLQASRWLDEPRDLALPTGEFQRICPMAVARAEAAWWSGRVSDVLTELAPAFDVSYEGHDDYQIGAMVYWYWRAGGLVIRTDEIPLAYRAMIEGNWQIAADEWERIGCPFERGLALAEGDLDAQHIALSIFEGLGAQPAAHRVRERMLEQGVRGLPRGARASTRANPGGLTAREMEILALLGQGLSNAEIAKRLFISSKTVGHHVSAILGKLQVDSRLEATAVARQKNII